MSEFVDEIYKTIETMIQRYVSKMKISQHYNGVVLGESGKHDHKYKVRIQGQVYVVKDGVGLMPAPNTSCWVCVPNNDWNLAFICAGRNAELGYVTQEALNSTRAALEVEIQDVYDECVSGGAVINPTNLGKVIKPGPNVTMTESEYYFTIGVPQVVKDVKLDGTSIVEDGVADFDSSDFGKVKDVTVNGQSVVNAGGTAVVTIPPTPTIPVTDVTVDGTSVLDGTVAKLNTNDLNIINDVKVNGISVVNSQGVANVPIPSVPVTDVTVDNVSILDGTVAKLDSSDFGTTVVANPSGTATSDLQKVQIENTIYNIPTGGSGTSHLDGSSDPTSSIGNNGDEYFKLGLNEIENIFYKKDGSWIPGNFGSGGGPAVYVKTTPNMTSDTTPTGEVIYSSCYSSVYPAWKAFNGVSDNGAETWLSGYGDNVGSWIGYHFSAPVKVERVAVSVRNNPSYPHAVKRFKLQGSNDGTNWTDIQECTTSSSVALTRDEFNITNSNSYIYYRLYTLEVWDTQDVDQNAAYNQVELFYKVGGGSGNSVTDVQVKNSSLATYNIRTTSTGDSPSIAIDKIIDGIVVETYNYRNDEVYTPVVIDHVLEIWYTLSDPQYYWHYKDLIATTTHAADYEYEWYYTTTENITEDFASYHSVVDSNGVARIDVFGGENGNPKAIIDTLYERTSFPSSSIGNDQRRTYTFGQELSPAGGSFDDYDAIYVMAWGYWNYVNQGYEGACGMMIFKDDYYKAPTTSPNEPWSFALDGSYANQSRLLWFRLINPTTLNSCAEATEANSEPIIFKILGLKFSGIRTVFLPSLYSEEEREIGVWTDGKPLYQKTINAGALSTGNNRINVSSEIEKMIHITGLAHSNDYNQWVTVNYTPYDTSYMVVAVHVKNDNQVNIYVGGGYPLDQCYITIQYTKTTDTPGSGTWGNASRVATDDDIAQLQANFQDGVDDIYDACVTKGSTPASYSLSDVVQGILNISSGSIGTLTWYYPSDLLPTLSGPNLSIVEASSEYSGYQAWETLDNDVYTYWCSATSDSTDWIRFHLSRPVYISAIMFKRAETNSTAFTIYDDDTDTVIARWNSTAFPWSPECALFEGTATTKVQNIRIQASDSTWKALTDVRVWGFDIAGDGGKMQINPFSQGATTITLYNSNGISINSSSIDTNGTAAMNINEFSAGYEGFVIELNVESDNIYLVEFDYQNISVDYFINNYMIGWLLENDPNTNYSDWTKWNNDIPRDDFLHHHSKAIVATGSKIYLNFNVCGYSDSRTNNAEITNLKVYKLRQ